MDGCSVCGQLNFSFILQIASALISSLINLRYVKGLNGFNRRRRLRKMGGKMVFPDRKTCRRFFDVACWLQAGNQYLMKSEVYQKLWRGRKLKETVP